MRAGNSDTVSESPAQLRTLERAPKIKVKDPKHGPALRRSTHGNGNGDTVAVSFQAGKSYREDVGKEPDPATGGCRYKRFWLGHDRAEAVRLARLIRAVRWSTR